MSTPATHTMRVLSLGIRLGFRQVFANAATLLAGFMIYAIIIILYAGVLRQIPDADLAGFSFTKEQMIWYLATTEIILFCAATSAFKDVQNAIVSEELHLSLLRPFPTTLAHAAIWFGENLARMTVYLPLYYILTLWLTDGQTLLPSQMIGVILSAPLGLLIMVCGSYIIGASCLWFVQSEPAFWVWNKAIFLFGAMLWPMAFYPSWLQTFMWLTPFPGTLAFGGNWTIGSSVGVLALGALHQIVWAIAFVFILNWFNGVILRRVQRKGG